MDNLGYAVVIIVVFSIAIIVDIQNDTMFTFGIVTGMLIEQNFKRWV